MPIYHVRFTCAPDYMARRLPFRPAHLKQLAGLREDGRVVAGGPEPDGAHADIFYRVADRAALDALLADNEFNRAGLFADSLARVFAEFVEPIERPPVDAGLPAVIAEGAAADRAATRAALAALQRDGRAAFGGFLENGGALAVVRAADAAVARRWLTESGAFTPTLIHPWSQTL